MDIKTNIEGGKATFTLEGKLTVQTSPDLSDAVDRLPESVHDVDIDVANLVYVASAGLRVLVAIDKLTMARGGTMRVLHPCPDVMEVLDMTGLSEVFEIVE